MLSSIIQFLLYYTPILLTKAQFSGGQLPAALQFVPCAYMRLRVGVSYMPAGQQGWARCGVGAVGRLGTVGLLIREG